MALSDDDELLELGAEAVRDVEAADRRVNKAAADLLAGRIRSRGYDAAEAAAKAARREARGLLGRAARRR